MSISITTSQRAAIDAARWLYTAITRAAKHVTVVK